MFEASDVWHLIPKDAKLWKVERGGILQEDNSKEGDSKLFERISILMRKLSTGKSFSEVLILASTNPQYDKRLSIELPVQYMKIPSSEHCQNMLCTQIVLNVKTKTCVVILWVSWCKNKSFWHRFTCTSILLSSGLQLHETHKDFLKAHVNYKYPCNFTRYLKHFPSELLEFNFIEGLTPLCKAST